MYNNDDKSTRSNREVNQVPNQNNYTETPRNTETINNIPPEEYRDGYVHGRVAERRYNQDVQEVRDNNTAARGLILGIVLTSLVAIPALAYYLWNRQNQEPVVAPEPAPSTIVVPSPSPQPERTIIQRERVIERNPDVRIVPIPQRQTPTTTTPAPNINIEQSAPAPQPTPNVNITIPPTSGQQQSPANQRTENQSPATSTEQLPSVQSSPSSDGSGSGDQSNTTTSGSDSSTDGTSTAPGNNASPSSTGNTSPSDQ